MNKFRVFVYLCSCAAFFVGPLLLAQQDKKTLRVFIFAGQSNMVGSDSKVEDIKKFPPFAGLDKAQTKVRFSYCIGREKKTQSESWVALQPINGIVGPELSFAKRVSTELKVPIAIIKCAAGGTHLGGDWNPQQPSGFKLYPLLIKRVRQALAELDRRKIKYRLEGFMWHQGESDMFNDESMAQYGKNLKNFLAALRRDLNAPEMRAYVGELCTKTVWGMDLRPKMYAISLGQKEVADADPLTQYVPTSHVGVEIGGDTGLHYHYGTLGQLQHGECYARAYLQNAGTASRSDETTKIWPWPYSKGAKVELFVLAGHRNMEGERAFVQELKKNPKHRTLRREQKRIAYSYSLGGGYKISKGWETLRPAGFSDSFGPELSFGATLSKKLRGNIAIAKFTHSGSQIIDWSPEGSEATSRNLYSKFIAFIQSGIDDIRAKGHEVELAGIFYHLGENDMAYAPFRKKAAQHLQSLIEKSRSDLNNPKLNWFVSQQRPSVGDGLNQIDVVTEVAKLAKADPRLWHLKLLDLPEEGQKLVIGSQGIVKLGNEMAQGYLRLSK